MRVKINIELVKNVLHKTQINKQTIKTQLIAYKFVYKVFGVKLKVQKQNFYPFFRTLLLSFCCCYLLMDMLSHWLGLGCE